jgi:hypothetical protein
VPAMPTSVSHDRQSLRYTSCDSSRFGTTPGQSWRTRHSRNLDCLNQILPKKNACPRGRVSASAHSCRSMLELKTRGNGTRKETSDFSCKLHVEFSCRFGILTTDSKRRSEKNRRRLVGVKEIQPARIRVVSSSESRTCAACHVRRSENLDGVRRLFQSNYEEIGATERRRDESKATSACKAIASTGMH